MVSQVEADFADETPVFVGVLNGAFMVVADFMKQYKKTMRGVFYQNVFYEGTSSTNDVKQLIGINQDLTGRVCIIMKILLILEIH
jgi:hypoxanthine phosphoribosyltransferase